MAKFTLQPGFAPANPSRRSALGILATAPIAALPAMGVMQCSTPAQAAAVDNDLFQRRLAEYRAANAHCTSTLANDDLWDTEMASAACHANEEALDRLMEAPAPDIEAVDTKLQIVRVEYENCEFDWKRMHWISADLCRLAKMEA